MDKYEKKRLYWQVFVLLFCIFSIIVNSIFQQKGFTFPFYLLVISLILLLAFMLEEAWHQWEERTGKKRKH